MDNKAELRAMIEEFERDTHLLDSHLALHYAEGGEPEVFFRLSALAKRLYREALSQTELSKAERFFEELNKAINEEQCWAQEWTDMAKEELAKAIDFARHTGTLETLHSSICRVIKLCSGYDPRDGGEYPFPERLRFNSHGDRIVCQNTMVGEKPESKLDNESPGRFYGNGSYKYIGFVTNNHSGIQCGAIAYHRGCGWSVNT